MKLPAIREQARQNTRLLGYDYTQAGAYFVTLVTLNRELLFDNGELKDIVVKNWLWLEERYNYVRLDEFVVMPNHLHGLVFIDDPSRGRSRTAPTDKTGPKTLGSLIGAFKTVSTQEINRQLGTPGAPVWQRNYYDRIIRSERELNSVRHYIRDNPVKWAVDPDNPNTTYLSQST